MQRLTLKDFPSLLKETPQLPKQLFIEGEFPRENENIFLTVVGPRKISSYGQETCRYLIGGLIGQPVVIVSGLAIGTDTLAHKTALETGLKTLAIPGSGLDQSVIYPAQNQRLAKEILKEGGCLLSEYEPKTRAATYTFPERNRLMAGISKATLIIEAAEKSGTLITARLATEYNRDLLVVPGSIFSINSKGTNSLIRQGATPITSPKDLLEALGLTSRGENTNKKSLFYFLLVLVRETPSSKNSIYQRVK